MITSLLDTARGWLVDGATVAAAGFLIKLWADVRDIRNNHIPHLYESLQNLEKNLIQHLMAGGPHEKNSPRDGG